MSLAPQPTLPHPLCRRVHVRVSLTLKTDAPPAAEPEAEVCVRRAPCRGRPRAGDGGGRSRLHQGCVARRGLGRCGGGTRDEESDYGGERGGGRARARRADSIWRATTAPAGGRSQRFCCGARCPDRGDRRCDGAAGGAPRCTFARRQPPAAPERAAAEQASLRELVAMEERAAEALRPPASRASATTAKTVSKTALAVQTTAQAAPFSRMPLTAGALAAADGMVASEMRARLK